MCESYWRLKSPHSFLSALFFVKWTLYSVTWRMAKRQQALPWQEFFYPLLCRQKTRLQAHLTLLHLRINSFVQASVLRAISMGLPCMSVGASPTCLRLVYQVVAKPHSQRSQLFGDFWEWLDNVAVALAHKEWMMRKMMVAAAQKCIDSQDRIIQYR